LFKNASKLPKSRPLDTTLSSALTALSFGDASLEAGPVKAAAVSECVQAAAICYGKFGFAPLMRQPGGDSAGNRLPGCDGACDAAKVALVNPVTYIDAKDPPFLLIHGVDDKMVSVEQSHIAEAKLKAAGVPLDSLYTPGIDHRSAAHQRKPAPPA
jgi:acetyl esterase/lipase